MSRRVKWVLKSSGELLFGIFATSIIAVLVGILTMMIPAIVLPLFPAV